MAKQSVFTRLNNWMEARLETVALRPRDAAYFIASFWAIGVVVFGVVERIVDPKTFPSVWLGMWWAVETVTTVGYGDVVPHQSVGKVIAAVLMLGGLSFLAVLTAAVTSGFVSRAQAGKDNPLVKKLDALGEDVKAVTAELERLRSTIEAHPPTDTSTR
jgi:voltage-gated potassium channel